MEYNSLTSSDVMRSYQLFLEEKNADRSREVEIVFADFDKDMSLKKVKRFLDSVGLEFDSIKENAKHNGLVINFTSEVDIFDLSNGMMDYGITKIKVKKIEPIKKDEVSIPDFKNDAEKAYKESREVEKDIYKHYKEIISEDLEPYHQRVDTLIDDVVVDMKQLAGSWKEVVKKNQVQKLKKAMREINEYCKMIDDKLNFNPRETTVRKWDIDNTADQEIGVSEACGKKMKDSKKVITSKGKSVELTKGSKNRLLLGGKKKKFLKEADNQYQIKKNDKTAKWEVTILDKLNNRTVKEFASEDEAKKFIATQTKV